MMEKVCSQLLTILVSLFKRLVDVSKPFHLTLINVAFSKLQSKPKVSINKFFQKISDSQKTHTPEKVKRSINEDSQGPTDTNHSKNSHILISENEVAFAASISQTSCNKNMYSPPSPKTQRFHEERLGGEQKANPVRPSPTGAKRKLEHMVGSGGFFAKKQRNASYVKINSGSTMVYNRDCTAKAESTLVYNRDCTAKAESNIVYNRDCTGKAESALVYNTDYGIKTDSAVDHEAVSTEEKSFIPVGIDKAVFCELPVYIQEEIRESYSRNTPSNDIAMSTADNSQRGDNYTGDSLRTESKVGSEKHLDLDSNRNRQKLSSHVSVERTLPLNVDSNVFADLPAEIKAELVQQWKNVDKLIPKSKTTKSPSKLKNKVKSANIIHFFKKP